MKSAEEIMEILEGFDLTASLRDASELAALARPLRAWKLALGMPRRCAPWCPRRALRRSDPSSRLAREGDAQGSVVRDGERAGQKRVHASQGAS